VGVAGWQRGGCGLSRPQLVDGISDAWKTNKKGIKSHLSQSERRQSRKWNQIPNPQYPDRRKKPKTSTTSTWLGRDFHGRTRTTGTRDKDVLSISYTLSLLREGRKVGENIILNGDRNL